MKHQRDFFEAVLEQIEQTIEAIDPDTVIKISDITGKYKCPNRDIHRATIMLLKKYGITYQE
jgi:hypothetical protein